MTIGYRRRWGVSIRVGLGLILAIGLMLGGLRFWIDSYRAEYLAEQQTIAAIQAQCPGGCQFSTEKRGPRLLIWLAGPDRSRVFDRVVGIVCAACDVGTAPFRSFRHCGGAINL